MSNTVGGTPNARDHCIVDEAINEITNNLIMVGDLEEASRHTS